MSSFFSRRYADLFPGSIDSRPLGRIAVALANAELSGCAIPETWSEAYPLPEACPDATR